MFPKRLFTLFYFVSILFFCVSLSLCLALFSFVGVFEIVLLFVFLFPLDCYFIFSGF